MSLNRINLIPNLEFLQLCFYYSLLLFFSNVAFLGLLLSPPLYLPIHGFYSKQMLFIVFWMRGYFYNFQRGFTFPSTRHLGALAWWDHLSPIPCIALILSCSSCKCCTLHFALILILRSYHLKVHSFSVPTESMEIQLGTPFGRLWIVSVLSIKSLTYSLTLPLSN